MPNTEINAVKLTRPKVILSRMYGTHEDTQTCIQIL